MKRLYFLVPNVDVARHIVAELKERGVTDDHLFVVGKDHLALEAAHLHEVDTLHASDFSHALARGVIAGGTTGILAGLAAVTFPPAGLVLGGAAVLGIGALGAGFGAWTASLIGISVPEHGIAKFSEAIERGELLLLVDIPRDRCDECVSTIHSLYPQLTIDSTDSRAIRALNDSEKVDYSSHPVL